MALLALTALLSTASIALGQEGGSAPPAAGAAGAEPAEGTPAGDAATPGGAADGEKKEGEPQPPAEQPKAEEPTAAAPEEAKPAAAVTLEADAGAAAPAAAKPEKKSPFRGTSFTWENTFSAYSLDHGAELTYNPYYAMSYSFRPRYYLWKELFLGIRWDLEQELTNADDTTKKRQVMWSDVILDLVWSKAATIPKILVDFTPKLRIELPASLASQARTLYLSLGPGFDFARSWDVIGGISLSYSFRFTKYFNQYTSALSEKPLVECPEEGPCKFDVIGPQNTSMRVSNYFALEVRPIKPLSVNLSLEVRNNFLYKVPDAEYRTMGGSETLASGGSTHVGYLWYIVELGYDIFPYWTVALGASTYNPMVSPDSKYYAPFFNRYTNIYLDFVFDLDGIVKAVSKKVRKQ